MERLLRGKRVAYSHPLFDLLLNEWNPDTSASVAMRVSFLSALLWGTSYTEMIRDNGNRVVALCPRKPRDTEAKRLRTGELVYE